MTLSFKSSLLVLVGSFLILSCAGVKEIEAPPVVEPVTLSEEVTEKPVSLLPQFEPFPAGQFDNGRMWTFEHAPIEYFSTTYSFNPDEAWFERARLGSVRLPNCSGSFISPNGLVMTNHHCAREQVSQVSKEGENLLDNGFYAINLSDERAIEDYYVDQVIEIRDITAQILDQLEGIPAEHRAEVREYLVSELEEELSEGLPDDQFVEIISLYNGGLYSAYFFKRYSDIRLVMAPELQIGYYGGDDDNFTYPRYNLDMTFYRVYENDSPLTSPHYFPFARNGVEDGDAVFLIGNPGSTSRQQTVAQLTYRGIYADNYTHILLKRIIEGLETYYDIDPVEAESRDLRNFIFSLKNAEKFYGGQVLALRDPELMGRRVDHEENFKKSIGADEALASVYLPLIEKIGEIQSQKIEFAPLQYPSLAISPNSGMSPAVMQRAIYAFVYAYYMDLGVPAENLQPLRNQILGIEDKPEALEIALMESRLNIYVDILGEDHELVQEILDGQTISEVARNIVKNSQLSKAENVDAFLNSPLVTSTDPGMLLAWIIGPTILEAQDAYGELSASESELLSQLGRAWFEVYGTSIPPDATFSLRISDGVVSGYNYNGTKAPVYTTFYGLYDRAHSHTTDPQWALPDRWKKPAVTLNLATPLNFVSTNDIIGGNSGSPVLNVRLEVVGLAFDSNIEGMGSNDFILDSGRARAVSVDSRGMLEALRHVYRAERLVQEIVNARR